jgi:hypothetical protein
MRKEVKEVKEDRKETKNRQGNTWLTSQSNLLVQLSWPEVLQHK